MRQTYHATMWFDGQQWICVFPKTSESRTIVAQGNSQSEAHGALHELLTLIRDPFLTHKCSLPATSGCCPDDFIVSTKEMAAPKSPDNLKPMSSKRLFGRLVQMTKFKAVKLPRAVSNVSNDVLTIAERSQGFPGSGPPGPKDLLVVQDLSVLAPSLVATILEDAAISIAELLSTEDKDFIVPSFTTKPSISIASKRNLIGEQIFEVLVAKAMKGENWQEGAQAQMDNYSITFEEVMHEVERRKRLLKK